MSSWICTDGLYEDIDFKGVSTDRFLPDISKLLIEKYSLKGDLILDPFCGFGTGLRVAQNLGRRVIGFEINKERYNYAVNGIVKPNAVFLDNIENIEYYNLPMVDIIFTSPPYITLKRKSDPLGQNYMSDMIKIFNKLKNYVKKDGKVIIEVSNVKFNNDVRTVAWDLGKALSKIFYLKDEIICCNKQTNDLQTGFNHSYILIYENKIL